MPSRATALRALETRRNQLMLEDRPEEARQVERDRRLIAKAPGDDLYEMTRLAQETSRRMENHVLARDARAGWPMGPIGLGLGLAGAAVGGAIGWSLESLLHAPVEVSLPLGLVSVVGGMACALIPEHFHRQGEKARETSGAIERNFALIQGFTATPETEGRLPMGDFVRLGAARERELLRQGEPVKAAELRHVCDSLEKLSFSTLEESLDEVYRRAPDDRKYEQLLGNIQNSPEVLGLVRSMLEVDTIKASLDPRGSSLELRPDAIRIGSVVLRPKRGAE